MTLYARGDVVYVSVPAEHGGCGQSHIRLVINGAPAKLFPLSCAYCERYLKDDPLWGGSQLEIPLTPDESRVAKKMEEEGDRVMHQVSAALAKSSIEQIRTAQTHDLEATQAAQERAANEERLTRALAEVERLSKVVATLTGGPEDHGEASANGSTGYVKGAAVKTSQGVSGACTSCGGPLRKPGQKGPTPKGTCRDCRQAAKGD